VAEVSSHGNDAMRRVSTARRIGVIGAVLSCALLTLVSASAHANVPQPPTITAVDARTGHQLPANPMLHPGDRVILTVRGFAYRAVVVVALVGVRHLSTLRADDGGVAVYTFTVPSWMQRGQHTLIFSGPAPPAKPQPFQLGGSRPRHDLQAFQVTVPFDPPWPFRLGAGSGTGGVHQGPGGGGGPPSETGTNLAPLLAIGSAALIIGVLVLVVGRRRRRDDQDRSG
jgi:hypothetical protein